MSKNKEQIFAEIDEAMKKACGPYSTTSQTFQALARVISAQLAEAFAALPPPPKYEYVLHTKAPAYEPPKYCDRNLQAKPIDFEGLKEALTVGFSKDLPGFDVKINPLASEADKASRTLRGILTMPDVYATQRTSPSYNHVAVTPALKEWKLRDLEAYAQAAGLEYAEEPNTTKQVMNSVVRNGEKVIFKNEHAPWSEASRHYTRRLAADAIDRHKARVSSGPGGLKGGVSHAAMKNCAKSAYHGVHPSDEKCPYCP